MYKFKNNKGFTLAELLIVIAIIAALVAIMIPAFGGNVERAREAADIANIRAAYAEAAMKNLQDGTASVEKDVKMTQTKEKWQNTELTSNLPFTLTGEPKGGKKVTFTFSEDTNGNTTCAAALS